MATAIAEAKVNQQASPAERDRWPFIRRYNFLKNEYAKWQPTQRELSKFVCPTRGFFQDDIANRGSKIDNKTIIDGIGQMAVRDLASGMISGLTSPSRPWFRLALPDEELMQLTEVKSYLDECQKRMHAIFAKSNLYDALHSVYEEIATFGTACIMIQEDFRDVIRARVFTAGEYYLANGPDNRINAFASWYWRTVVQLVEEFGLDNCSPQVQASFKNHETEKWIRVIHLIEFNDKRIPGYQDFKNMAYRSLQWEDGSMQNSYLRVGGYEEFPLMCPRWNTRTTADIYGRSPGWIALGNIKMLQKEHGDKLLGLELQVKPPMQADASVNNVNIMPGGLSRSSAIIPNAGVRPAFEVNINLKNLMADIQDVREQIKDAFYTDLFKMLIDNEQRRDITATEIAERQAEKLNMLSPVVEKLNNELLNPLIDRCFNICNRMGVLPPPPKVIAGMELKVQYISILAQAQKMVGITAIEQWKQGVESSIEIYPDCIDIINYDEMNREKAEMFGIPTKMVNSPEQMAEIKKAKAAAKAKADQQQQALLMAEMASKAGKGVKDMAQAPMGVNSALDSTLAAITGKQG